MGADERKELAIEQIINLPNEEHDGLLDVAADEFESFSFPH